MDSLTLFPFADYWWFYILFTVLVVGLLALDLGVLHRGSEVVTTKQAAIWTGVWVSLALLFCWGFWQFAEWKLPQDPRLAAAGMTSSLGLTLARQSAFEFLAGYVVEASLSVDNIFVFVVVFTFFGIERRYQHRVLFFGILGALVFRVLFISAGALLMKFHWVIWVFGAFLLITGIKILVAPGKPLNPEKNPILRLLRRFFWITPQFHGQKFFVMKNGLRHATPLFVALVAIECSDIVFAVDSVPAIFALTREPLIVFTSNIFAILGLRSLFFLLAGIMDKFHLLKYGLGLVLIFVGLKMVWLDHVYDGRFPISWSLGIIGGLLGTAITLSLLLPANIAPAGPVGAPRPLPRDEGAADRF